MGFYEAIKKIDENKENISITFIEGKNVGEKLLLSDGEEVFSTNSGIDWKEIIKPFPKEEEPSIRNRRRKNFCRIHP